MSPEKKTRVCTLFKGTLTVPEWKQFRWRYLILLFLGIAAFAIPHLHFHWLKWDIDSGTVTTFGIIRHQFNDSGADFELFVNKVYRGTLAGIMCTYIASALFIYGFKRIWLSATRSSIKRIAGYVFSISALLIVGSYMLKWLGAYPGDPEVGSKSFAIYFLTVVLIPVMEELFARLTLYQMIRSKTHFLIAAILSSIVFGLMHFSYPEPIKMALTAISGFLLCWSYEKTGSILTPIGIHVLNNLSLQLLEY